MQIITRINPLYVLVAVLTALAAFSVAGHPLISPEALAGLGAMPIAMGNTTLADIQSLVEKQGENFTKFTERQDARLSAVERDFRTFQAKAGRPGAPGESGDPKQPAAERWLDVKTGQPVAVLRHGESALAIEKKSDITPSIGRLLRGIVVGGAAPDADELADERKALSISNDASGGYTVSGALAAQWIDALRARMVLSSAGALTLPMDAGTVRIAKVTADPTISWHGENASLPDAEATFGALNLQAKTCVCLVKLSLELAQDAANIEQQLQNVIINAMAAAIDSAGLNGVSTDAGAAPGGIFNLSGRNSVTSIGAPTTWDFVVDGMYELMLDNVPQEKIGALVGHPAVWKKMRKLKTGITNDNTPLPAPAEIAALPKLWTTAAPLTGGTTAKAMVANWSDLIFGVRKSITVRVLSEAYMGSNLQVAVLAYARVDFGAAHSESFCSLEGITV